MYRASSLFFIFSVLNFYLWTEILSLSQNNFSYNENWTVSKSKAVFPLMGDRATMLGRSILSGYQMNLDDYYSFQQINSIRNETFDQINLNFCLVENSYLDLFYNQSAESTKGFRVSTFSEYSGSTYSALEDGRFINSKINYALNTQVGCHEMSLNESADQIAVYLDSKQVANLDSKKIAQSFGFKSGLNKVVLTHVSAYLKKQLVWKENFQPTQIRAKIFDFYFKGYIIFIIFIIAINILLNRYFSTKVIEILKKTSQTFLILGLIWFCFDFFYFSKLSILTNEKDETLVSNKTFSYFNFENYRNKTFLKIIEKLDLHLSVYPKIETYQNSLIYYYNNAFNVVANMNNDSWPVKEKNEIRILLSGGSLYQGAGAKKAEETVFSFLYQDLKKTIDSKFKLTALNTSLLQMPLMQRIASTLKLIKQYQPDVVICSFIPDESDLEGFIALENFLKKSQEEKVNIIFLSRPFSYEFVISEKYQKANSKMIIKIKDLLKKYNFPYVDFKKIFTNQTVYQSGFLWLDLVHLTSYGHKLLAHEIEPFVIQQLKTEQGLNTD